MRSSTRRRLLAALTGSTVSLSGCSGVLDPDSADDASEPDALAALPDAVGFEVVADGLERPVAVSEPELADVTYVLEQPGRVVALDERGSRIGTALDLTDEVRSGGEMGLLGIATDPAFAQNRRAFLRYSAPPREGTPEEYSHTAVLSAFVASDDASELRRDTERTILEIPEPQSNHNAGALAFGPDGLLYVPIGDGGGAGDRGRGHPEDWYDAVPGGNGQDVTEHRLGGILRISQDVTSGAGDSRSDAVDGRYVVPEDNPLVGREGHDEYYAWGLRNPWQLSFDGEDLYVADVGQEDNEEIDLVERGGNYGWNVKEGTQCFGSDSCPDETPPDVRGGEPLRDPIVEYPHAGAEVSGISVIGGHVYRGDAIPALEGAYVFGDLRPEGRLFAAVRPDDAADREQWATTTVDVREAQVEALFAFGTTRSDELYALGQGANGGTLWRIVPAT